MDLRVVVFAAGLAAFSGAACAARAEAEKEEAGGGEGHGGERKRKGARFYQNGAARSSESAWRSMEREKSA